MTKWIPPPIRDWARFAVVVSNLAFKLCCKKSHVRCIPLLRDFVPCVITTAQREKCTPVIGKLGPSAQLWCS